MKKRYSVVSNGLVVDFDNVKVEKDIDILSLYQGDTLIGAIAIRAIKHKLAVLSTYKSNNYISISYTINKEVIR